MCNLYSNTLPPEAMRRVFAVSPERDRPEIEEAALDGIARGRRAGNGAVRHRVRLGAGQGRRAAARLHRRDGRDVRTLPQEREGHPSPLGRCLSRAGPAVRPPRPADALRRARAVLARGRRLGQACAGRGKKKKVGVLDAFYRDHDLSRTSPGALPSSCGKPRPWGTRGTGRGSCAARRRCSRCSPTRRSGWATSRRFGSGQEGWSGTCPEHGRCASCRARPAWSSSTRRSGRRRARGGQREDLPGAARAPRFHHARGVPERFPRPRRARKVPCHGGGHLLECPDNGPAMSPGSRDRFPVALPGRIPSGRMRASPGEAGFRPPFRSGADPDRKKPGPSLTKPGSSSRDCGAFIRPCGGLVPDPEWVERFQWLVIPSR